MSGVATIERPGAVTSSERSSGSRRPGSCRGRHAGRRSRCRATSPPRRPSSWSGSRHGRRRRARASAGHTGPVGAGYSARSGRRCRALVRPRWPLGPDGARNGVPTPEQVAIGSLPKVKLRLGRVTGSGQKGVDGLIIIDLLNLSTHRAVDVAILFSGDEDLREAASSLRHTASPWCWWDFHPRRGNGSRPCSFARPTITSSSPRR